MDTGVVARTAYLEFGRLCSRPGADPARGRVRAEPRRRRPMGVPRGRRLGSRPVGRPASPGGPVGASRGPAARLRRRAGGARRLRRPECDPPAALGVRHLRRLPPRQGRVRLEPRGVPDRADHRELLDPGPRRRAAAPPDAPAGGAVRPGRHQRRAGGMGAGRPAVAANGLRRRDRWPPHRRLRPGAHGQSGGHRRHHRLRAGGQLCLRAGHRRAEGRGDVPAHVRQRGHARGGDRAGTRFARGHLPVPKRVELERPVARAPAGSRAARGSPLPDRATGSGSTASSSPRRRID